MKLNQNSLSAKLYRWFYGTEVMPTNLCPYFWKLVAAYIFAAPLAIWTAPYSVIYKDDEDRVPISERLGISFIAWIIIGLVVSMISVFGLFFKIPEKDSLYWVSTMLGFASWGAVLVLSISELVKYISEKIEDRKYRKVGRLQNGELIIREKKPNLAVEMIKAKYNKYCPQINWEK